jgi:hypothetical protein
MHQHCRTARTPAKRSGANVHTPACSGRAARHWGRCESATASPCAWSDCSPVRHASNPPARRTRSRSRARFRVAPRALDARAEDATCESDVVPSDGAWPLPSNAPLRCRPALLNRTASSPTARECVSARGCPACRGFLPTAPSSAVTSPVKHRVAPVCCCELIAAGRARARSTSSVVSSGPPADRT